MSSRFGMQSTLWNNLLVLVKGNLTSKNGLTYQSVLDIPEADIKAVHNKKNLSSNNSKTRTGEDKYWGFADRFSCFIQASSKTQRSWATAKNACTSSPWLRMTVERTEPLKMFWSRSASSLPASPAGKVTRPSSTHCHCLCIDWIYLSSMCTKAHL